MKNTLRYLQNWQPTVLVKPLRHIEFTDNQLARSVLNGSEKSVADLFRSVKELSICEIYDFTPCLMQ